MMSLNIKSTHQNDDDRKVHSSYMDIDTQLFIHHRS